VRLKLNSFALEDGTRVPGLADSSSCLDSQSSAQPRYGTGKWHPDMPLIPSIAKKRRDPERSSDVDANLSVIGDP